MMSVFLHAAILALLLFGPRLPFVKEYLAQQAAQQQQEQQRMQELAMQQQQQQRPRFVFVQPKIDMKAARPKENASLADQDRVAQTTQRAPNATNSQPFSRGNSLEFVEKQTQKDLAKGRGPAPEPSDSTREMQAQQARMAQPTPPQNQSTPAAQTPANNDGVNVRDGQSGLLARGDTGIVANPQARNTPASATPAMRPPGGLTRAGPAQPREVRPERGLQQSQRRQLAVWPLHPVRHQGRRVRALDSPLRRPDQAQLARSPKPRW